MTPGTLVELPDGSRGYYQRAAKGNAVVLVEVTVDAKTLKEIKK